jgi:hypothetical protein
MSDRRWTGRIMTSLRVKKYAQYLHWAADGAINYLPRCSHEHTTGNNVMWPQHPFPYTTPQQQFVCVHIYIYQLNCTRPLVISTSPFTISKLAVVLCQHKGIIQMPAHIRMHLTLSKYPYEYKNRIFSRMMLSQWHKLTSAGNRNISLLLAALKTWYVMGLRPKNLLYELHVV